MAATFLGSLGERATQSDNASLEETDSARKARSLASITTASEQSSTPAQSPRALIRQVALIILVILLGVAAVMAPTAISYYKWIKLLNVRHALLATRDELEPEFSHDPPLAKLQELVAANVQTHWDEIERRLGGNWVIWNQTSRSGDSTETSRAGNHSERPLLLVLIDRPTETSTGHRQDGFIVVTCGQPSHTITVKDDERMFVLFASGEVEQMKARDLIERMTPVERAAKQ